MEGLDLRELLDVFITKKRQIAAILLIFILCGIIYSFLILKPIYKSKVSLVLGRIQTSDGSLITEKEISINQSLISTYIELLNSDAVLDEVKKNLNLDQKTEKLRKSIEIKTEENTEFISIEVSNYSPIYAGVIANEIARVFIEKVESIYNIDNICIVERAKISNEPYNIKHLRDISVSFLIGVVVIVMYTIIFDLLDSSVRNSIDVEEKLKLKLLQIIPRKNKKDMKNEEIIESFYNLRNKINYFESYSNQNKTMLITATENLKAKTLLTLNLATAFSKIGKRVLIIDGDLKEATMSKMMKNEEKGLKDILEMDYLENMDVNKYIYPTEYSNVYLMPCGIGYDEEIGVINNLSEKFIEKLKENYDFVMFDGEILGKTMDTAVISRLIDGTIILTNYGKAKIKNLESVKNDILSMGGDIMGVVLNDVPNIK